MRILSVAVLAVAGMVFVANADDAQVNEAAVVFDGVKPSEMRGGTWKVVYSSALGPVFSPRRASRHGAGVAA